MGKTLLIYWPRGGNVETVTGIFKNKFDEGELKVLPVDEATTDLLSDYDNWIVGGSTVGSHTWEDADDSNKWHDFFKKIENIDMKGKTVAFFGLGDQVLYPQHFVDGLGTFQKEFEKTGAKIVGQWPVTGYEYTESMGEKDGMFFGLALDEDNEDHLTEERIAKWLETVKKEFN